MKKSQINIGDTVYIKRYVCSIFKDIPLLVNKVTKSKSGRTTYYHLSNGRKYDNSKLVNVPCLDKDCNVCKKEKSNE